MALGISASRTNPFEDPDEMERTWRPLEDAGLVKPGTTASFVALVRERGEPRIVHHAHGGDEPCGHCDAPDDAKPRSGVFPESRREAN